ncbi:LIM/homeobox protein Lhx9 isoform X2 [Cephus cinctus]|nr:LIM/homeobox protein Lhx9 isoform X2 [Cephus cinctus]XP_015593588.1 LIM/homeobox protein Lhx9 isoform X2 [Cephus cinctus]XP_024939653.1 LIM/homeobox protein Lhx9 isoform X2 [Cephus cinctus]
MTMDVSKSETSNNGSSQQECAGCGKAITERYLLKALDLYWHEDCLKCGCCDCRLGEVGSTLYTKANLILCKRDYLRLFGSTGLCAACRKIIPAFEMVMRARANVYHLECFACQQCNHRFCVGDRFYLCENKILCEYDYEERLVFANMALHPPASLAHIKRQLPPTPTPPGQNMHPNHNPLQHPHQQAQPLGQNIGQQHNHVSNGQMSGGTPTMNGTIGSGPRGPGGPGDMNNNGLSGPGIGSVKPPPMPMPAPTS